MAKLNGVRADLVFEDFHNSSQGFDKLIVVDFVDQLQEDLDERVELRRHELDHGLVLKQIDKGDSCVHADRQGFVSEVLVQAVGDFTEMGIFLEDERVTKLAVDPASTSS